jgi:hypothetical protein
MLPQNRSRPTVGPAIQSAHAQNGYAIMIKFDRDAGTHQAQEPWENDLRSC